MNKPRPLRGTATRRCTPVATIALVAVLALLLPLLLPGCGDDDPVQPIVNPDTPGQIRGYIFLAGDPSRTTQITVEIFDQVTEEKVSTVFPNDTGLFISDQIPPGNYYLTASVELPGYFPERVNNIHVLPGQITDVSTFQNPLEVKDISRVLFENLTPTPGTPQTPTLLVDRRPVISGDFRSEGSGFKIETFVLQLRRVPFEYERITGGLEVEEIEERRLGQFRWQSFANMEPGQYEAKVSISNRAGTFTEKSWAFEILEGVVRKVVSPGQTPSGELEFARIQDAVSISNDGDSVLVAPGVHDALAVVLVKDLVILSEEGRDATTLDARGIQHFLVIDPQRRGVRVSIEGFTLTGGSTPPGRAGGSIKCENAFLKIQDCAFVSNNSGDRGGALALFRTETQILDCVFIANHSDKHGGAIAIFDRAIPEITRCLFIRNSATGVGEERALAGAILASGPCEPYIHHNTFFRNSAGPDGSGGAMYLDFDPNVGSPIVSSQANLYLENVAGQSGATIFVNRSFLDSECDGFHANVGGRIGLAGSTPRQTNLLVLPSEADPRYCDPSGEDLHFQLDSPFFLDECEERGAFPPGCGP
jgi:hypothetical protein